MTLIQWLANNGLTMATFAMDLRLNYGTLHNIAHRRARASYDHGVTISKATKGEVTLHELCGPLPPTPITHADRRFTRNPQAAPITGRKSQPVSPIKRKPGRPRKIETQPTPLPWPGYPGVHAEAVKRKAAKRKAGRPRKVAPRAKAVA